MIIAGDFFTGSDVTDREALLVIREIRVRRFAMIHETAVIRLEHPNIRLDHVRIGIARNEVLHVGRQFFNVGPGEEHVEFRFEPPDDIASFDGLSSEDAYPLDRAVREEGADKHHDLKIPNSVVRLFVLH